MTDEPRAAFAPRSPGWLIGLVVAVSALIAFGVPAYNATVEGAQIMDGVTAVPVGGAYNTIVPADGWELDVESASGWGPTMTVDGLRANAFNGVWMGEKSALEKRLQQLYTRGRGSIFRGEETAFTTSQGYDGTMLTFTDEGGKGVLYIVHSFDLGEVVVMAVVGDAIELEIRANEIDAMAKSLTLSYDPDAFVGVEVPREGN